jgi:hypothetical protein
MLLGAQFKFSSLQLHTVDASVLVSSLLQFSISSSPLASSSICLISDYVTHVHSRPNIRRLAALKIDLPLIGRAAVEIYQADMYQQHLPVAVIQSVSILQQAQMLKDFCV